jgi:hypothetical protein
MTPYDDRPVAYDPKDPPEADAHGLRRGIAYGLTFTLLALVVALVLLLWLR